MIDRLIQDYRTQFQFSKSNQFKWSPSNDTIYFDISRINNGQGIWTLLHEIGHAVLAHNNFTNDMDLIRYERAAWDKAIEIAKLYNLSIDEDYIENCMDTYRLWLKNRSTCPDCHNVSLQHDQIHYKCFNCSCVWRVPSSQSHKTTKFKKIPALEAVSF